MDGYAYFRGRTVDQISKDKDVDLDLESSLSRDPFRGRTAVFFQRCGRMDLDLDSTGRSVPPVV